MNKSKTYRMVSMQLMNITNIGLENELYIGDIEKMATATIDACQLFLDEKEINCLRVELYNRLKIKQKVY
ncbi:hypothetical protein PQE74_gp010 [Bacillus phage vB_BanS_Chewbecca]|uniref:Uncharacterized protein n=1 Tax=Bacillus phage vB_BanS_Chewbecca TaxID=2894786 RepID=A0AAE8YR57_9CAUD|nr:hypothetical protein PQE74_gp010 [Bacillus phage vB_BanS_Chewbecca]UGO46093.1 hypothetical protein CHEWBECCA_10 [Bacillus phage vB_BanS_Chewbecca]